MASVMLGAGVVISTHAASMYLSPMPSEYTHKCRGLDIFIAGDADERVLGFEAYIWLPADYEVLAILSENVPWQWIVWWRQGDLIGITATARFYIRPPTASALQLYVTDGGAGCAVLGYLPAPTPDFPDIPSRVQVGTWAYETAQLGATCWSDCRGDWDGNGFIDMADLIQVCAWFGPATDLADLAGVLGRFGEACQ